MTALPATMTATMRATWPACAIDVARIEQHADRHEEQQSEHVAQRRHVAEGLMAQLRFAEHHAGDERPDRKRQSQLIGEGPDPDSGGDDRHEKQLSRSPPEDPPQQGGQQPGADEDHGQQECGGDQAGLHEARQRAAHVAHVRQDDQHRHNRQVLDDQHPDHDAAGQRRGRAVGGKRLEHHHRARERDHGAEPDGIGRRHIQRRPGHQRPEERREHDLDWPADQGDAPDGAQIAKRDFEPEREQEEGDADLGEELDVVEVRDGRTGGVRSERDTGGDVADEQRQAQGTREDGPDEAGNDDEDEIGRDAHREAGASTRRDRASVPQGVREFLRRIGATGCKQVDRIARPSTAPPRAPASCNPTASLES